MHGCAPGATERVERGSGLTTSTFAALTSASIAPKLLNVSEQCVTLPSATIHFCVWLQGPV
eukprot:COSAG01_NODE_71680_length_255_cov_0.660256_1_plen_60_part_01